MPDNNITQITPPRVPIIDEKTGYITREWYRWFYNLYYSLGGTTGGAIPTGKGGTGTTTIPDDGQLLIGDGSTGTYVVADLGAGDGISVTPGPGSLTVSSTGEIKTESTSVDGVYYLTLVDSNNTSPAIERVYTSSGISYNPSTSELTVIGGISGGTF